MNARASDAIYPLTSFGLPEVKKWEKVKVEVKQVNPAKRATPQERAAITTLLRRASDSWEILFSLLFFLRAHLSGFKKKMKMPIKYPRFGVRGQV
jgi:hypothetical protein